MSTAAPTVTRTFARVVDTAARTWADLEPARDTARARTAVVTPLGWSVLAIAITSWMLGARLGWLELDYLAVACLAALVLAALFTLGAAELEMTVRLVPRPRVTVGEEAIGEVTIRNVSGRRLVPVRVELPVGAQFAYFDVPALAGDGAEHEDEFLVPTARRAVIPVGPALSVRGDPLGLFRREVPFSDSIELFVHPKVARLDTLGSGFLRDLEGNTTEAISPSDLAFHSLRQYEAGDDKRHIHWRTTAKLPSGELMVRQFLDTRKSHLVVILDGDEAHYATEDEFELVVSAAASLALRAIRDEQDVSVVPGTMAVGTGGATRVLDTFTRATSSQSPVPLIRLGAFASDRCGDASLVVVATGSLAEPGDVRRAAMRFDAEAQAIGLIGAIDAPPSLRAAHRMRFLTVGRLADLTSVVQGAVRA